MRVIERDGKRLALLEVYSANEYLEGFEVAVLELTDAKLREAIARIDDFRTFANGRAGDGFREGVAYVEWWDYDVEYRGGDADAEEATSVEPRWDDEAIARTETETCVVSADRVHWSAYDRYTDDQVSTESIDYAQLQALLTGASVTATKGA